MSSFYSDLFSSDGISQGSPTRDHRAPSGKHRAKSRVSLAYVKGLFTTSDTVVLAKLHSSRRVREILISGDDAAAAGALNVGLHKVKGMAVIDVDLFASAVAKNAARVDAFVESTTLKHWDRGKHLWELANKGAGSYSVDPQEEWYLTGTPSTDFTTTPQGFLVEIETLEE